MQTIEEREYVKKENKTLFPTDVGEVVSDFLEKNFANYISDTFTAEMEDELDEISRGEREYEKTLKDFYGPFLKDVQSKEKLEKATNLGEAPENIKCPKCGSAYDYQTFPRRKILFLLPLSGLRWRFDAGRHRIKRTKRNRRMCPDMRDEKRKIRRW